MLYALVSRILSLAPLREREHAFARNEHYACGRGGENTAITGMSRGKYTATCRIDVAGVVMPYNPGNIEYTKRKGEQK